MVKIRGVDLVLSKDNDEELYGGEEYPSLALLDLLESTPVKWRKAVIKSFLADHVWKTEIENKLKWLTRENVAIITLLSGLIALALKIAFFG